MDEIKIITGIVLFNPELERLKENVDAIHGRTDMIVFVDNGSANAEQIMDFLSQYDNVSVIRNENNAGIARALNQICEFAEQKNADYVLTLDQDSVCPPNIISEYRKHIGENTGILCPLIKDRNHNLDKIESDCDITEVKKCITSASLMNIKAWKSVNGFDESMFIDGVDFDICIRIRKRGFSIIRVNTVTLIHEIGKITVRRFLLWNVRVKNHSAFRKYYIARNIIYLARKQKSVLKVMKSYLQVLKQWICVLLYENEKRNKLKEIQRGFCDGIKAEISQRWI